MYNMVAMTIVVGLCHLEYIEIEGLITLSIIMTVEILASLVSLNKALR